MDKPRAEKKNTTHWYCYDVLCGSLIEEGLVKNYAVFVSL